MFFFGWVKCAYLIDVTSKTFLGWIIFANVPGCRKVKCWTEGPVVEEQILYKADFHAARD